MKDVSPTLSVGLAVRNGVDVVGRCIESIVSQDFTDLELVISDNASDDGTSELLEEYARADRRIRLSVNEVNIGSARKHGPRARVVARRTLPLDQFRRLA